MNFHSDLEEGEIEDGDPDAEEDLEMDDVSEGMPPPSYEEATCPSIIKVGVDTIYTIAPNPPLRRFEISYSANIREICRRPYSLTASAIVQVRNLPTNASVLFALDTVLDARKTLYEALCIYDTSTYHHRDVRHISMRFTHSELFPPSAPLLIRTQSINDDVDRLVLQRVNGFIVENYNYVFRGHFLVNVELTAI